MKPPLSVIPAQSGDPGRIPKFANLAYAIQWAGSGSPAVPSDIYLTAEGGDPTLIGFEPATLHSAVQVRTIETCQRLA